MAIQKKSLTGASASKRKAEHSDSKSPAARAIEPAKGADSKKLAVAKLATAKLSTAKLTTLRRLS